MPERHYLYGATQQIVQVLNVVPYNLFYYSIFSIGYISIRQSGTTISNPFEPMEASIMRGLPLRYATEAPCAARDLALSTNPWIPLRNAVIRRHSREASGTIPLKMLRRKQRIESPCIPIRQNRQLLGEIYSIGYSAP
jgi:hypothetical protein